MHNNYNNPILPHPTSSSFSNICLSKHATFIDTVNEDLSLLVLAFEHQPSSSLSLLEFLNFQIH